MAVNTKYSYQHLTSGTTTVKPGPGLLHAINVNKALSGTVTVTDGTVTVAVLTNGTTAPLGTVLFDTQMQNIKVALSGTEDITVIFD